jgi:hypothetical protein
MFIPDLGSGISEKPKKRKKNKLENKSSLTAEQAKPECCHKFDKIEDY